MAALTAVAAAAVRSAGAELLRVMSGKASGTPTASMAVSAPRPPVSDAAEQPGAHDGGKADRAGSDDSDDVSRPDSAVEDTYLIAGRQDVKEAQNQELD